MPDIARTAFGLNLVMLGKRWRRMMDQHARQIGLSEAAWPPLLHLGLSGGGITQTDLAMRAGVDGSTLVRVIAHLIETRLVERRADPHDRRAKRLFLTRQGEVAVSAICRSINDMEKRILAAFPEEDIHHAAAMIRRIAHSLDELAT